MYYMEIETNEVEKASEYAEKALKYMGKVMQCLSSWEDESGYGERSGMNYRGGESGGYSRSMMGNRGGYGSRGYSERGSMNYRDDDEWEEEMQERRGVRGSGRGRR